MKKLAIITTHPIQYNAPWFKLLAQRGRVRVKVFYTWSQVEHEQKYDPGFGKKIEWDIPLLEGYDYTFVKNTSKTPGSKSYGGIQNPTLIKEVELWEPDAVLIFGWNFKSHLKAMRHFHGKVPVLFRGDSTLQDKQKGWRRIVRALLLKYVYKNIDYALFTGTRSKQYFIKHGVNSFHLVFAPHAIDNKRFSRAASRKSLDRLALRNDLQISESGKVFLFAGKFEVKKNPALLIKAFIEAAIPHSQLILLGGGSLEESLKLEAKGAKNIHFLPFQNQSQMPLYYSVCDAFVLPSQGPGETWGLAVNEAMACGKAVIVSDKCGCAIDLVQHDINGLLFESGNVNDLVAKISLLAAKSKEDLHKMGQISRKIIEDWSFEKIADAVEDLMARIKTS